jgi:hypothetical protein
VSLPFHCTEMVAEKAVHRGVLGIDAYFYLLTLNTGNGFIIGIILPNIMMK